MMELKMIKTECTSCSEVVDEREIVHICKSCIIRYRDKRT